MKLLLLKKTVILAIIAGCLFSIKQMEYDNLKFSKFVDPLIWISIPFILRYFFVDSSFRIAHIIIGTLLYIGIIFFSFFFGLWCAWSSDSVLYKSKKNKSTFIICRRYDCFGTAEDCRLFKIIKLTNHLKWVTKFQEEIVDTTKWDNVSFGTSP